MRTIGGSIGGQLAASIVTGSLIAGTTLPKESGYTEAFAISAVVLVGAAWGGLYACPHILTGTTGFDVDVS